ncbi:MAG: formylmethanofuran dehydrogenase subunit C, partial [Euryarchaeota archaeon]|nr:formylmethanofuran dehydrogenase subunit C [Euryarchaeota archaeon]
RGSKVGMRQGMIIVEGDAGHEIGERMKRGIIAILGDVASFAGAHMKGGTILCFGKMGERTGAEMDRGTIIAFTPLQLLPTFRYNATYNPVFLRFCLRELRKYDLPIVDEHITGRYERYNGDLTELGKGEILVWKG